MIAIEQEPFCVIGGLEAIGRQHDFAVAYRFHQIGGDHDHKLGFVPSVAVGLEEGSEDRDVGQTRCLVDRGVIGILHQARDHETFTRSQFDGGLCAPGRYRRNAEAVQDDSTVGGYF